MPPITEPQRGMHRTAASPVGHRGDLSSGSSATGAAACRATHGSSGHPSGRFPEVSGHEVSNRLATVATPRNAECPVAAGHSGGSGGGHRNGRL